MPVDIKKMYGPERNHTEFDYDIYIYIVKENTKAREFAYLAYVVPANKEHEPFLLCKRIFPSTFNRCAMIGFLNVLELIGEFNVVRVHLQRIVADFNKICRKYRNDLDMQDIIEEYENNTFSTEVYIEHYLHEQPEIFTDMFNYYTRIKDNVERFEDVFLEIGAS